MLKRTKTNKSLFTLAQDWSSCTEHPEAFDFRGEFELEREDSEILLISLISRLKDNDVLGETEGGVDEDLLRFDSGYFRDLGSGDG